jgi:dihydrodipicolinate reductase
VLSELNVAVPSKRNAVMLLARETAKGIVSGTTGVYLGAKQIWDLTLRASNEALPELDSFVYAASEWEDRAEDRATFEEGIIAAARELVNRE